MELKYGCVCIYVRVVLFFTVLRSLCTFICSMVERLLLFGVR